MSSVGGAPFRNPHNLAVKDCLVCGRPFTWRKKWERCWDEVLTCSNRCKTERRQRKSATPGGDKQQSSGKAGAAAAAAGAAAGVASSAARSSSPASCDEIVEESEIVVELADAEAAPEEEAEQYPRELQRSRKSALEEKLEKQEKVVASSAASAVADEVSDAEFASEEEAEQDPRELRRSRKSALKADRRARRAQSPQERAAAKRKPCSLCAKAVDLLVRCRIDETKNWQMLCGRCWRQASGGVPDGDAEHPHYRYGGLWKNRSAQVVTPKFAGAKVKDVAADAEAEDADQQALVAAYKGA